MKKLCIALVVICVLIGVFAIVCYAKYNYSSFPHIYTFGTSQTYTAYDGTTPVFDGAYVKGSNGILGINKKYTSSTLSIKAKPYYYSRGIALLSCGSKDVYREMSIPTQVNVEREITATLDVTSAATCVQYDVDIFQLSGTTYINYTNYFFSSDFTNGLEITRY